MTLSGQAMWRVAGRRGAVLLVPQGTSQQPDEKALKKAAKTSDITSNGSGQPDSWSGWTV